MKMFELEDKGDITYKVDLRLSEVIQRPRPKTTQDMGKLV